MRYLIKLATRGRRSKFIQTINNILTTIKTDNYLILVSADTDDEQMNCDEVRLWCSQFTRVKLMFGKSDSKIHAINRDMEQAGEWDILINMSDDMTFLAHGWDRVILRDAIEHWGGSLDWFAHYNDGYVQHRLPTMSIMGVDYFNRFGYIYEPGYRSFSCDAEAMYVAMMLGRHRYFPEIIFKHIHPANTNEVKNDHTYRINSLHTPHDTEYYFSRKRQCFMIEVKDRVCLPFNPNDRL